MATDKRRFEAKDGVPMRIKGTTNVGRFATEVEIANYDDLATVRRGFMEADKVRRVTISAVVDSGATDLVLPQAVVKQLGLPCTDQVEVRYADGRTATRPLAEAVSIELFGRHAV